MNVNLLAIKYFKLCEALRTSVNYKYYHSSDKLYKLGDQIIAGERQSNPLETIFERVRQQSYPDRPSRLDCIFLSTTNLLNHSGWARRGKYLYEVEPSGQIFLADAYVYGEAEHRYSQGNLDAVETLVDRYWRGIGSDLPRIRDPEILAVSPVYVKAGPLIHKSQIQRSHRVSILHDKLKKQRDKLQNLWYKYNDKHDVKNARKIEVLLGRINKALLKEDSGWAYEADIDNFVNYELLQLEK